MVVRKHKKDRYRKMQMFEFKERFDLQCPVDARLMVSFGPPGNGDNDDSDKQGRIHIFHYRPSRLYDTCG